MRNSIKNVDITYLVSNQAAGDEFDLTPKLIGELGALLVQEGKSQNK
ncbi:MAG: hypothetical protein QNJ51_07115 [Calothrix sp. MO_167.B12]|nr:hypothetical protein [Calothrix sp. MO_167.B12]